MTVRTWLAWAGAIALMGGSMAGSATRLAAPRQGIVRVRLLTSAGPIVIALDAAHAPVTTANFLHYVDDGRLDGTSFYRAVQRRGDPRHGFVEGGIGSDARRTLNPIPLEPTSKTGIHHVDATISMARYEEPASGTCNFSILVGANPSLDAHAGDPGYAAFGHVIAGMDTVRRILAQPTGGGYGGERGETLLRPVKIVHAQRLDGVGRKPPAFKPWLLKFD